MNCATPDLVECTLRAAEVLVRDVFVRDLAHDVRAGDVHVAGALRHEDEVRDRGRVDARRRPSGP